MNERLLNLTLQQILLNQATLLVGGVGGREEQARVTLRHIDVLRNELKKSEADADFRQQVAKAQDDMRSMQQKIVDSHEEGIVYG